MISGFLFLASILLFVFIPALWSIIISVGLLVLFLLILNFFRNPPRVHTTIDSEDILAPADGKVVAIENVFEKEYLQSDVTQVSIFMSPLNVHVNRSPITGEVVYVQYHPGEYLVAWHPKSSELNERNTIVVKRKDRLVLVRQIAGKVARKIICYIQPGAQLSRGQEFGFIKFGSRVDVFLPKDVMINARIGDVVKGGISVIARFPGQPE